MADAIGAELTGDLQTDGNQTVIKNGQVRIVLPQESATAEVSLPEQRLTNNSDGTVTVHVNEADSYAFTFTPKTGAAVSGELLIRYHGAETTASGSPGDVIFDFKVAESTAEVQGLDFSSIENSGIASMEIHATGTGDSGAFRIITGDTIDLSVQRSIGSLSYTTKVQDALGGKQTTEASMADLETEFQATLPRGGMSILNLSQAMADGLKFNLQSVSAAGASATEATLPGGNGVMTQSMSYGATQASASAGTGGVSMDQQIDGIEVKIQMPGQLPLPIAVALETWQASMAAPVAQDTAPQEFSLQFRLGGLSLDDGIWGLFDPAAVLPRDPATVAASFKGETTLLQNLLDFAALMAMKPGEQPLELNALTLTDLELSAAGAKLTGTGDFAFNNGDLESFGGFPAPSGEASFQLTGANGLIDKLIQMGLITDSDAMGARMMMGMFAVPGEGEDSLSSKIEVSEDGQILANGQRIK